MLTQNSNYIGKIFRIKSFYGAKQMYVCIVGDYYTKNEPCNFTIVTNTDSLVNYFMCEYFFEKSF